MTIQEVVSALQMEQQEHIPSRFPCRAIMVDNIEQYCQLLNELKKITNIRTIKSSELFSNADIMPKYENLQAPSYRDEWVILTGVSEYLRLYTKKEAVNRRFASLWTHQSPSSSVGRIIIPLWGCEAQWFDTSINLNGDIRLQDFYYDCTDPNSLEQSMNLLVLSGVFEQYVSKLNSMQGNLCIGLQDWFEYWENPSPSNTDFVLLTKRCNNIEVTSGNISIHVILDTISFIRENMHGAGELSTQNCPQSVQNVLFEYALQGLALDEAILEILNVSTFSGSDIMGKWSILPESHKGAVALWFMMHPDHSYLCHCVSKASGMDEVPVLIQHEIFKVRNERPEWVSEYKMLAAVMALKPDNEFFDYVSGIPEYETRLEFVTNRTRSERIYMLKMVGQWMRKDSIQVRASDKLKAVFPELAAYLDDFPENIKAGDIGDYMSRYKAYKLENTLPQNEDIYFNGIETEKFDCRYSILSEYVEENTVVLWVDALGVEWLPLLYWGISNDCDGTIEHVTITQATLPSETCFNEQWNTMEVPHKKLDKLDKLAHKGVVDEPDYYSCIEEQLTFVAGLCEHISKLMDQYHRVIITGDHGTSRLAARFFHDRDGIDVPKGVTVCSHGRYCLIDNGVVVSVPNTVQVKKSDGTRYAVFANYDHFKRSGFAAGNDDENAIYGEVHGGATPEEMLVPVVVVDSNKEIPLQASWTNNNVKISMKKAKFILNFNKPVTQLVMKIAGNLGETAKNDDGKTWTIIFRNIKADTYKAEVIADGHLVDLPEVIVQSALGGGIGDLP